MIISIISQKGGVGKSVLSALICRTAAAEGRDVLAVDCDPQGALSSILGADCAEGLFEGLVGGEPPAEVVAPGIRIFTANYKLDKIMWNIGPYELAEFLKKHTFGLAVCDCPPTTGGLARAAAIAADLILIPADLGRTVLQPTIFTIAEMRALKKTPRVVLIGRSPGEGATGYGAELYAEFVAALGDNVAGIVPRSVPMVKAAEGRGPVPKSFRKFWEGLC